MRRSAKETQLLVRGVRTAAKRYDVWGLLRDDASLAECVFLAVHPTFLVAVREAEEEGSARSFWDDTNVPDDIRNEARREAKRLRTTTEEALVGHPTPIAAWLANVSTLLLTAELPSTSAGDAVKKQRTARPTSPTSPGSPSTPPTRPATPRVSAVAEPSEVRKNQNRRNCPR